MPLLHALHELRADLPPSAWTPHDPPLPGAFSQRCAPNGRLRFPHRWNGKRSVPRHQPMCLASGPDLISDVIRKQGRWCDCGKAVRLWASLDGNTARPSWDHHNPSASPSPTGVLLEVGANIGACTVELLLRTRATIIAVEPSPSNLFYLTRSLRLAAKREPSIADRVVVLPFGAGDVANSSVPLFTQANNSGNSVLGRAFTADCSRDDVTCWRRNMHRGGTVSILPLDQVFPRGLGGVRLLKLDARAPADLDPSTSALAYCSPNPCFP